MIRLHAVIRLRLLLAHFSGLPGHETAARIVTAIKREPGIAPKPERADLAPILQQ